MSGSEHGRWREASLDAIDQFLADTELVGLVRADGSVLTIMHGDSYGTTVAITNRLAARFDATECLAEELSQARAQKWEGWE